jgi:hypothetical protein
MWLRVSEPQPNAPRGALCTGLDLESEIAHEHEHWLVERQHFTDKLTDPALFTV